jgi:hypothetical protein
VFSLCHQNDEGTIVEECSIGRVTRHIWKQQSAPQSCWDSGNIEGKFDRKIASFHSVKRWYYDLLQVLSVINTNWAHHFFFCRKIPRLILNTSVLFCSSQIWLIEEESLPGVDRFKIFHDAKGWHSRLPTYSWVKVLSSQDWSKAKLTQHHMNQPPQECHVTHR